MCQAMVAVLKLGFIILLKKNGATDISGFCPISLAHEFGKIFSKTLASQLSPKLAANQSIFI
jgi:hypothetical protein